ncbi:sugar phosphate nucleotidyltransferase [Halorubrum ezzemoulense]|jgi:glucose-1-phosphate thymidylyltransferase|uniref:Bifunctional protein GlmU n=1 Tax=Halorubrum ezzemoulense TaxID=337243 RepID=A0A256JZ00_HALEZ|nr:MULTISPECIES: sugar phosphate nucleotidyltransferase [Halorubrum]MDB2225666.1 sugar phosphate nucleotidyltransferase [Halorubrum ezzemoulense]MDB2236986.1 sugar phosphate nucleotidyltransferase [Halorubrum ezzemoulense]MDB2245680.1 sugar phosphate nucleotidyltransferase [Halorubrum ezzemoulense]MDB2247025.1 sugar phosphate nucleotidyltransferase [Halorubrum ezzemoulense]MDB2262942.1 sugar phosphate nucleotidyltransferase [Halorubrum ezzemoulense]
MGSESVTAVILAAGEGRRLTPLTNRRPKPMVPVANRPLLEHVVEAITATAIDRIVLVVGYEQERIRNHFGDGDDWGVTIEYVEQSTQLGTGHAVLQAEPVVDGPFVVLNGDRIVDPAVVSQVRDRAIDDDLPAMAVTTAANPRQYGVVTLDGDRVTDIDEKPEGAVETNQINAGVYAFSPAVFDAIRETHVAGELAITATLDDLAATETLSAVRYDGRWLDVSNLWDLLTVNAALIGDSGASDADGPTFGDSVTVADDAALAGNVRVGPNVTIGGSTAVGSNATVEAGAVVENAVIFPDAVIGAGAVVRDAIVAGNARIGPNATVAGGPATVVVGDAVHRGVELGGVVGDNATVGSGATLADGAVVGDDVTADAGVVIDGRIESGAVVRRG